VDYSPAPTICETDHPTFRPTKRPTQHPSEKPTPYPTRKPTYRPTKKPVIEPIPETDYPTPAPTTCTDQEWYYDKEEHACVRESGKPSGPYFPTQAKCCKENFGTYDCPGYDGCTPEPTASPSVDPTAEPTLLTCDEEYDTWYFNPANGYCNNYPKSELPGNAGEYNSSEECCSKKKPLNQDFCNEYLVQDLCCYEENDVYYYSTKNDVCTNDLNLVDEDKDEDYTSMSKCCAENYKYTKDCVTIEVCKPEPPTDEPTPVPSSTPAPTPCENREWFLAYGKCTNGYQTGSNDSSVQNYGSSTYGSKKECCDDEFPGLPFYKCPTFNVCVEYVVDPPTKKPATPFPTEASSVGSTPTVGTEKTTPPDAVSDRVG